MRRRQTERKDTVVRTRRERNSPAAGQRRPEVTDAALGRIGLTQSCEGLSHVAQLVPNNGLGSGLVFHILEMWELEREFKSGGKNNSSKLEVGQF